MQRDAELADHKRQLQQLELRLASIEGRMQCHKPVKIILVRWASRAASIPPALSRLPTVPDCSHAESEGNADKMAYQTIGDPNVRLTPQGRCQVRTDGHQGLGCLSCLREQPIVRWSLRLPS